MAVRLHMEDACLHLAPYETYPSSGCVQNALRCLYSRHLLKISRIPRCLRYTRRSPPCPCLSRPKPLRPPPLLAPQTTARTSIAPGHSAPSTPTSSSPI